MFPMSNTNGNYPIFCSDQQAHNNNNSNPFFNIAPNSKQDEALLSFFHLPSPFNIISSYDLELENHDVFFHQNDDLVLLHHHQQQEQDQPTLNNSINTTSAASETVVTLMDSNINQPSKINNKRSCNSAITTTDNQQILKKQKSKKDRHSKINTAQGPRDRRMRLSLKVAHDFFDLQDKLGFDKPSKTIEWLLIQAKAEIKNISTNLAQENFSCSIGTKSASSTSECEVVSGIDKAAAQASTTKLKSSLSIKQERKTQPSRKTAFHLLPRESRERARARARERTKEKMQRQRINESKEEPKHELGQLGPSNWSPFEIETVEESRAQSHNKNTSLVVLAEFQSSSSQHEQQEQFGTTENMIDDSLAMISKWSPSASFSHLHNLAMSKEPQFTDFLPFCKPWETHNNIQSL